MFSGTLYFFFSIILLLGLMLHLTNMIFFRKKGQTLIRQYDKRSPEYHRLKELADNHHLAASALAGILLIANNIFAVSLILSSKDQSYRGFILIFAPIACLALFAAAIIIAKNKYGNKSLR
jgi:hypothetical protein